MTTALHKMHQELSNREKKRKIEEEKNSQNMVSVWFCLQPFEQLHLIQIIGNRHFSLFSIQEANKRIELVNEFFSFEIPKNNKKKAEIFFFFSFVLTFSVFGFSCVFAD